MFKKVLKNILFLLNVGFIVASEYVAYNITYNKNYGLFIERLTKRLASINILYVKIFQAFALNNSLIDDTINNKLLRFTDDAPWDLSDINKDLLDAVSKHCNLDMGPYMPINSGMISLVFLARKKSNIKEYVVVKMKRNCIQQKLDDAIDNLLFLMYIVSFIPIIHKYQLTEVVTKNVDIIRHQTNFLEEVENMKRIRENCKHLKYVCIPTADEELTKLYPDIIVMDYIEGIKINHIQEDDYESFAKLVIKFGLVTTIVHGVAHGDLHSGNLLFIKDETDAKYPHKIGVIDFGIIYNVNSQYKELMFDIFTNLFERPARESAVLFLNSDIIQPSGILRQIPQSDYNTIVKFAEEIINETIHSSKMANQIQIYKFLSKLKEYLSKKEIMNIGIRLSDDFVKSQLVLAMAHGVTLTLCKGEFITLMDTCVNDLFHTHLLLSR